MEELRDIKGIVEISDNSLLKLGLLAGVIFLIMVVILYFLKYKSRKRRRFRKTPLELTRERIENIDYDDPKSIAYTFIEDVAAFTDEHNREKYEVLARALEPFKYKKEVPPVDADLKEKIQHFIREIKWQI